MSPQAREGWSSVLRVEQIDRRSVEWLSAQHWGGVTPAMKTLTYVGSFGLVFLVIAAGMAIAARSVAPLLVTVLGQLTGAAVGNVLKNIFNRPRPPVVDSHVHALIAVPANPSMPSGHAISAFACASILGFFAPRLRFLLFSIASLIAISRVYLGVHYPSDVLIGAAIGIGVGALTISYCRRLGLLKLPAEAGNTAS